MYLFEASGETRIIGKTTVGTGVENAFPFSQKLMELLHAKFCYVGMYTFHGVALKKSGQMFSAGIGVICDVRHSQILICEILLNIRYGLLYKRISDQLRRIMIMQALCHIYKKSTEHIAA